MVQQHVPLRRAGRRCPSGPPRSSRGQRLERIGSRRCSRAGQLDQRPQRAQVERARARDRRPRASTSRRWTQHLRAARRRCPPPPPGGSRWPLRRFLQLLLERLQVGPAALVVELQLRVARDRGRRRSPGRPGRGRARPARRGRPPRAARRSRPPRRPGAPAGAGRTGTCTTRQARLASSPSRGASSSARFRLRFDRRGKGRDDVDGQRRERGQHLRAEVTRRAPRAGCSSSVGQRRQPHAVLAQAGQDLVAQRAAQRVHHLVGARGDGLQLLARRAGRPGRAPVSPSSTACLQAGHAHHEELVEVGGDDDGELQPVQERARSGPSPPRARGG